MNGNKRENAIEANSVFYRAVADILHAARVKAHRAVNFAMVEAYWQVGRMIVEEEQQGEKRAEYGAFLIKELSLRLSCEFGKGFSEPSLWNMRQFYRCFPILSALRRELTWTHYKAIIRVEKPDARMWYLKEAAEQNWSTRALERQIHSLYYERLLMSRDRVPVVDEMQQKTASLAPTAEDFIKDPYVLEFLGIPDPHQFREAELEQAIIGKLQSFMLELGRGFAFAGRQFRISTETKDFFIDLVFYNYLLKCFVLIDLKTGELTHQDIGQIHPMRYCYAVLLCLCFALIERWQFLCWLFQRFKKADSRARVWKGEIYCQSTTIRACLLRSVQQSGRCHQAREISQKRMGETIHQSETRKLSHGVHPVIYFPLYRLSSLGYLLSHGVNMYVRLFEDTIKSKDDNPTVGLILCTEKDHTIVKYSVLEENKQLFAAKYQLYLPTEQELIEEIEREKNHAIRELAVKYA